MSESEIGDVLMEFEYELATQLADEDTIRILDKWLESWLYFKGRCPVCGGQDE